MIMIVGRKAFTLMELMIALVILAILATLAVPGYQTMMAQNQAQEAKTNLSIIHMAEKLYYLSHGNTYWGPGTTTIGDANTALGIDMTCDVYPIISITEDVGTYTAALTMSGPGDKTWTTTYSGGPSMPSPAESGSYT